MIALLLPIDHYIIEATIFDWLLFLFFHINTVSREKFYDEFVCTLHKVKNMNKNLFDGQIGFSFTM